MATPYAIRQFGTLLIPQYRESGQEDNLGTGRALTSWQQLPNGTFFDNYQGIERRPQGIRPVTKEGVLTGASAAAVENDIDDLRQNIGVRDKLTVRFRSGVLRWQWAVLREVNTPAITGNPLRIPMQLSWETAAQHWYQIQQVPVSWFVGDGSFLLGDGTTELGQNSYTYTITVDGGVTPQYVFPIHGGNIPATSLVVRVTAGTTNLTYVKINNASSPAVLTPWQIEYNGTILAGETLVIDCGAANVTNDGVDAYTADWVPTHRDQWLRLEPGTNTIQVYMDNNDNGDATITFEWFDTYA